MIFVKDFEKTALAYKDTEYEYKDLIARSKYLASVAELSKGEKAIIFIENRPEFIFSYFGIWDSLGIAINLDAAYTCKELSFVIENAVPKVIFTSNKNLSTTKEALKRTPFDVRVVNVDEIKWEKAKFNQGDVINAPEPDEVSTILYTSGTTGNPKGVMLTTGNLMSNIHALTAIDLYGKDDRFLSLLPCHHVLPLSLNVLAPFHLGSLVVMVSDLTAEAITQNLQKYKITVMVGVPRIWEQLHKGIMKQVLANKKGQIAYKLAKKINKQNVSRSIFKAVHNKFGGHLRVMGSGGAKLEGHILEDFTTLGFGMLEGYGLTETSPIITFNKPGRALPGSPGEPIPNVDVKIASDGEIIVKGPNIMKGYYNSPELTAQVIDSDGWFHTGDLGELRDGYLFITGRKKEMIVLSNGKNINPEEIEKKIEKSPFVSEVAVIDYNNHLVALILPDLKEFSKHNLNNINEKLRWELADCYNGDAPAYRQVTEVKLISKELPRTRLGKLRRFALKEFLEGDNNKEKEELPPCPLERVEEYHILKEYIVSHHEVEPSPYCHFQLDIGLDSLDIVEFIAFIDKEFGISIDETELAKHTTLETLTEFVIEAKKHSGDGSEEEKVSWRELNDRETIENIPDGGFVGSIMRGFTKAILRSRVKVIVEGEENFKKSPYVIAGNHQTLFDGFMMSHSIPKDFKKSTFLLALGAFFDYPILRWLAVKSNIIMINPNKGLRETLKKLGSVLENDKNLVIFPEGGRTRDGNLLTFKKTYAQLAKDFHAEIIVFGIDGARELMPQGKRIPKKGTVTVKFFEPFSPQGLSDAEIVHKTKEMIDDWRQSRKKEN